VIEVMRFRLRPGTDEASFREADARLQTAFAYHQPGLARRTTARSDDGEWIVIDLWRSVADAEACAARWDGDPVVARFMTLVDPDSVRTERYLELDATEG
jgi:hypothetical protein